MGDEEVKRVKLDCSFKNLEREQDTVKARKAWSRRGPHFSVQRKLSHVCRLMGRVWSCKRGRGCWWSKTKGVESSAVVEM